MCLYNTPSKWAVAVLLLLARRDSAHGGSSVHRYHIGEPVDLWVNTVGPYSNPQETYEYYSLPYCAPLIKFNPRTNQSCFNERKTLTIGEKISGYALCDSGYAITFRSRYKSESCQTKPLTIEESQKLAHAIRRRWFYQMYVDDLPVWGMVGELLPGLNSPLVNREDNMISDFVRPYVYTSRTLIISYSGDQIVKVDLVSDPNSLQEVKPGAILNFEFFYQWEATTQTFNMRYERYFDRESFNHPLHWTSIFNCSLLLVAIFVVRLLRNLKSDYARYSVVRTTEDDVASGVAVDINGDSGEPGWKAIHGDVFRAPWHLPLFAAVMGCGWQLITTALGTLSYAVFVEHVHGDMHERRGELVQAYLIVYCLSSGVAGYQSARFLNLYYPTTVEARIHPLPSPSLWQLTAGLTAVLVPAITVPIVTALEIIAWSYGTTYAVPYPTVIWLLLMWSFVSVPCCAVGSYIAFIRARRPAQVHDDDVAGSADGFPCRVHDEPRPIPTSVAWYGKPSWSIVLVGLVAYAAIAIELFYVFLSLWNFKIYVVYGFLLGVFAILLIVVSMTSIFAIYLVLNAENWKWHWTAFGCGASTGIYVFLYGIYYFFVKTTMHGFLQTSFYFGCLVLLSFHLGWMCGSMAYTASSAFVYAIFKNLKVD